MAKELTDTELLAIVSAENKRSVGFGFCNDDTLKDDREKALNYYKGEMPDVPALTNRSKAVSTDVSDAVETVLPDLVEIFTGGDDVATFAPVGPEDEKAAEQETDYIKHVVFQQNQGFLVLYQMFKDALLEKVGVVTYWWDKYEEIQEEKFEGKTDAELMLAAQEGEVADLITTPSEPYDIESQPPMTGDGMALNAGSTHSFTLRKTKDRSCCKIKAIPVEDFTVAADTIDLASSTYCAMRSRPRAQDLIADGVDEDIVKNLATYGVYQDDSLERAHDTVDETNSRRMGEEAPGDLRQVEIIDHFLRIYDKEANKTIHWRIRTDASIAKLVDKTEIEGVQFAALTPYPVTHRFYGRSLADLLLEVQRIKTAVSRGYLDSIYFALNQRYEVSDQGKNDYTISDLLNNTPGMPVRVKTSGTINALGSPGSGFNALEALEYFSTVGENRTGIVRNAQGLSPDTLHDTKGGMMALMGAAQKRVRMIARVFAETGIKQLYMGVHALIRQNASAAQKVRLKGQWVDVNPSSWSERYDMTIEVGLGASGKEFELASIGQAMNVMTSIVQQQGGAQGPLVYPNNVYALAKRFFEKLGLKAPELYITDPAQVMQQPEQPPPPDPRIVDAQLKDAREREKMQMDMQLQREQMQGEFALKKYEIDQRFKAQVASSAIDANGKVQAQRWPGVNIGGEPG